MIRASKKYQHIKYIGTNDMYENPLLIKYSFSTVLITNHNLVVEFMGMNKHKNEKVKCRY